MTKSSRYMGFFRDLSGGVRQDGAYIELASMQTV